MGKWMKQYEVLQWASSFLKKYNREEHIGEILLQHHLHMTRAPFFQNMRSVIPNETREAFEKDVKRHALEGVPVQHMMGKANFYGRDFKVNSHVLIPRFETEELVETVIIAIQKMSQQGENVIIADIGTGSGVIAITLKLELPMLTVVATDVSTEALIVAKENAHVLDADVHFYQGDFLTPITRNHICPQILVSNPPYIAYEEQATLQDTVQHYDPALALFAEESGLRAYKDIVVQSKSVNTLKGMYFEIGHQQANAVTKIIKENYPNALIKTKQDMARKDRIILAEI
jgi:release factor glutamine methyltransferase